MATNRRLLLANEDSATGPPTPHPRRGTGSVACCYGTGWSFGKVQGLLVEAGERAAALSAAPGPVTGDFYLGAAARIDGQRGYALGYGLSSAGDFDGDGRDDILVGAPAPAWDDVYTRAWDSLAMMFLAPFTGTLSPDDASARITGELDDHIGKGFARGDFDGDGFPDLLVGAQVWETESRPPFWPSCSEGKGSDLEGGGRRGHGEDRPPLKRAGELRGRLSSRDLVRYARP